MTGEEDSFPATPEGIDYEISLFRTDTKDITAKIVSYIDNAIDLDTNARDQLGINPASSDQLVDNNIKAINAVNACQEKLTGNETNAGLSVEELTRQLISLLDENNYLAAENIFRSIASESEVVSRSVRIALESIFRKNADIRKNLVSALSVVDEANYKDIYGLEYVRYACEFELNAVKTSKEYRSVLQRLLNWLNPIIGERIK